MERLKERLGSPILGDAERLSKLVTWSERAKPGTRFTKEFSSGLSLISCATEAGPRIYVHWSQGKFDAFCGSLSMTRFYGLCFGFRIIRTGSESRVELVAQTANYVLHRQPISEEGSQASLLLAAIEVREDGIYLLSPKEAMQSIKTAPPTVLRKEGEVVAAAAVRNSSIAVSNVRNALHHFLGVKP